MDLPRVMEGSGWKPGSIETSTEGANFTHCRVEAPRHRGTTERQNGMLKSMAVCPFQALAPAAAASDGAERSTKRTAAEEDADRHHRGLTAGDCGCSCHGDVLRSQNEPPCPSVKGPSRYRFHAHHGSHHIHGSGSDDPTPNLDTASPQTSLAPADPIGSAKTA